ncbi:hypothetical protein G9C98_000305 [Cotesia typhae]|uniref:Uncharacterized protein n=1 Tax=Cotesia typhae TaxID=2053667 RepID=A0A8J5QPX6_9HYME|nr:hypothetical protein G9C98_000305 [Cotesia typhae]
MNTKQIIGVTAVSGVVAVGLYFAYCNSLAETREPSDDDVPKVSSPIETATRSDNNFNKHQRLIAINAVIKEFAEWKIATFDIKTYSSTVSLALDFKTTDDQVIQDICTKGKECKQEVGLLFTLNDEAIDILAYYVLNREKKYLDTAERLVKIIFGNKLKDYDPKGTKPCNLVSLMDRVGNLLILFEYIADDSAYNDTRNTCHEFIIKVVPNFLPSAKEVINNQTAMYNSIRMLSNYLFNFWNFVEDSADENIQILIDSVVESGLISYESDSYFTTLRCRIYRALMTGNY